MSQASAKPMHSSFQLFAWKCCASLLAVVIVQAATFPGRAGDSPAAVIGSLDIAGLPAGILVGDGASVEGKEVTIKHMSSLALFYGFTIARKSESLLPLRLLGKAITFNADLSRVGCACKVALYAVSMPVQSWDDAPSRRMQPQDQCAANPLGERQCPEMDIMEANAHSFQATPHRCDAPIHGRYANCDSSGCGENTRSSPASYGPGVHFTINTELPFEVRTEFFELAGFFVRMRTKLTQEGRRLILNHENCQPQYWAQMGDALVAGMSLRIKYWGKQPHAMSLMDVPPCGDSACGDNAGRALINNITIMSLQNEVVAESHTEVPVKEYTPPPIDGMLHDVLAGQGGSARDAQLTVRNGSNLSLSSSRDAVWGAPKFRMLYLVGKAISFSVNLHEVGCACNFVVHLIPMSARHWDAAPSANTDRDGQPPHHCDVSQLGAPWCPAVDIMEADAHAFAVAPRRCVTPSSSRRDHRNCGPGGGCGDIIGEMSGTYGPGNDFTINTQHPFEVRTEFVQEAGEFTRMRTLLNQDGKHIELDHHKCGPEYMARVGSALAAGMNLHITYSVADAQTVASLNLPRCGLNTCSSSAADTVISSIAVRSLPREPEVIDTSTRSDPSISEWVSLLVRRFQDAPLPDSMDIASAGSGTTSAAAAASISMLPIGAALAFATAALTAISAWRARMQGQRAIASHDLAAAQPGRYSRMESRDSMPPPPLSPCGGIGGQATDVQGVVQLSEEVSPIRRRSAASSAGAF